MRRLRIVAPAIASCIAGVAGPAAAGTTADCHAITIDVGGTYAGCYRSTDPAVPAVTVATNEPVTLADARIEHAGDGIVGEADRIRLVVKDSRLEALDPHTPEPVSQRAVALYRPASLVLTHNRLRKGHGISVNGDDEVTDPLRIAYNVSVDVGRFGHPTDPNCCVQFVQLDHVRAAANIAWNRTSNTAGRSSIEDNINLYGTSGAGADEPLVVARNLISGAYPQTGDGADYSGGGIMVADSGGDHVTVRRNRVVSTTNYGVAIVGGHDNHLVHNRLVNDGRAEAGEPSGPDYAVGIALWNPNDLVAPNSLSGTEMRNVDARDNRIGWLRGSDLTRNDTWLPACDPKGACIGNRSLPGPIIARAESHERRAWARDLAAAGHTVGPR